MPPPVDVAIVGAGIVGVATAHALIDAGLSVVLVDAKGVAAETSRGNAGALAFADVLPLASPGVWRKLPGWLADPTGPLAVRPAYALAIAPWLWRFAQASRPAAAAASLAAQANMMRLAQDEWTARIAAAGLGGMIQPDGALELYESEAERRRALPGWAARAAHGIAFEHVDRDGIDALQGGLAPRFRHGTFVPGWHNVADPLDFTTALAEAAFTRGARLVVAWVTALQPGPDGVALAGTEIVARHAVVAAGAWSTRLTAPLGETIPLDTERGYNTTLPKGAFDLRRQLVFGGHGFVVSRLANGIRVGGAVEFAGLELPPNMRRAETMLAKAKAFMPALRTEGGRQWMGFRPSLPDTLPVIGRAKSSPRVVLAFGHGHLGLTQAAATGRLVADIVTGRPPAIDLAPFRPTRFAR